MKVAAKIELFAEIGVVFIPGWIFGGCRLALEASFKSDEFSAWNPILSRAWG